jgi:hypothetical protein
MVVAWILFCACSLDAANPATTNIELGNESDCK